MGKKMKFGVLSFSVEYKVSKVRTRAFRRDYPRELKSTGAGSLLGMAPHCGENY